MAILKGTRVTICDHHGQGLPEYVQDHDKQTESACEVYIPAESGQTYQIDIVYPRQFTTDATSLASADGARVDKSYHEVITNGLRSVTIRGIQSGNEDDFAIFALHFQSLPIDGSGKIGHHQEPNLGKIEIRLWRVEPNSYYNRQKYEGNMASQWTKRLRGHVPVANNDNGKGLVADLYTLPGKKIQGISGGTMSSSAQYIDDRDGNPHTRFIFLYRTRRAMISMGLIPQALDDSESDSDTTKEPQKKPRKNKRKSNKTHEQEDESDTEESPKSSSKSSDSSPESEGFVKVGMKYTAPRKSARIAAQKSSPSSESKSLRKDLKDLKINEQDQTVTDKLADELSGLTAKGTSKSPAIKEEKKDSAGKTTRGGKKYPPETRAAKK